MFPPLLTHCTPPQAWSSPQSSALSGGVSWAPRSSGARESSGETTRQSSDPSEADTAGSTWTLRERARRVHYSLYKTVLNVWAWRNKEEHTNIILFAFFRLVAQADLKPVDFTGQVTAGILRNTLIKIFSFIQLISTSEVAAYSKMNSSVHTGFWPSRGWVFATWMLFR